MGLSHQHLSRNTHLGHPSFWHTINPLLGASGIVPPASVKEHPDLGHSSLWHTINPLLGVPSRIVPTALASAKEHPDYYLSATYRYKKNQKFPVRLSHPTQHLPRNTYLGHPTFWHTTKTLMGARTQHFYFHCTVLTKSYPEPVSA